MLANFFSTKDISPSIIKRKITVKILKKHKSVIINWDILKKIQFKHKVFRQKKIQISSRRKSDQFKITFYDLSVQSCGKTRKSKQYGITRNGTNLRGRNWSTARVISVDPKIIPLNKKVQITFQKEAFKKYNGTYTAADTGNAIKGKHIDFYLGENCTQLCMKYGVQYANINVLE